MPTLTPIAAVAFTAAILHAEVHTMSLHQAVERALQQNPEIAMSRLDELKAQEAVRIQKDPFAPHVYVGSGLAYTYGFPMSIEGAAPSIVQARVSEQLFNRQQSYRVARTKEEARGAAITAAEKRDDIAYRTAVLFLEAERTARAGELARQEVESSEKVLATVRSRVEEGRELPIETKRAELNLARAKEAVDSLDADRETAETSLAMVLGYGAEDRVRPAEEARPLPAPPSEDAAIESALKSSQELRRLESQIAAKGLEVREAKAARLPHADLIAQYGLFATFNHYQEYFLRYQANNAEIGVSFGLPLLLGPAVSAAAAAADADASKLRIQLANTRNQITADTRKSFRDLHKAEAQRDVARLDLDLARQQLSDNLALFQEGRILLSQVEESRIAESGKWIAFYDAQYAVERARWDVARQTGDLLASLQ